MNNETLVSYNLSPTDANAVVAFSTTRLSPFTPPADDLAAMATYAAFNVTDYCGDRPERVAKNRHWLCEQLGIIDNRLWLPRQTHTANVHCIDDAFLKLSETEQSAALQDIDALVTAVPGQCIGVSTADCVPVLLFDAEQKVVAAVHAGWRGTVKKIVARALHVMCTNYGTNPADVHALIGPSIGPTAFEVGEEVAEEFRTADFPSSVILEPSDGGFEKPHIDLWGANAHLLEAAGVPLMNIQVSGVCTYTHPDTFFSARRLGIHSGRIFTAIMLK